MKLIPQHPREPLDVDFERTAVSAEVGEALQGQALDVVLDHPAARVDLADEAESATPTLSGVPHSDGIDWTLNNAFKDYQSGLGIEKWVTPRAPLRLRYDYGEPGNQPTPESPHTMLPGGDALVDENGNPIRWLWDTPLADQIREVESTRRSDDES